MNDSLHLSGVKASRCSDNRNIYTVVCFRNSVGDFRGLKVASHALITLTKVESL